MELVLTLLAAVHILGALVVLLAVAKAPFGYEDDKEFQKGEPEVSNSSQTRT